MRYQGFYHNAVGVAHNHIHGSANCVQCGGPCQITDPTQAAYTGLIRSLMEAEQYGMGRVPYQTEYFLREQGIDLKEWRKAKRPSATQEQPAAPARLPGQEPR